MQTKNILNQNSIQNQLQQNNDLSHNIMHQNSILNQDQQVSGFSLNSNQNQSKTENQASKFQNLKDISLSSNNQLVLVNKNNQDNLSSNRSSRISRNLNQSAFGNGQSLRDNDNLQSKLQNDSKFMMNKHSIQQKSQEKSINNRQSLEYKNQHIQEQQSNFGLDSKISIDKCGANFEQQQIQSSKKSKINNSFQQNNNKQIVIQKNSSINDLKNYSVSDSIHNIHHSINKQSRLERQNKTQINKLMSKQQDQMLNINKNDESSIFKRNNDSNILLQNKNLQSQILDLNQNLQSKISQQKQRELKNESQLSQHLSLTQTVQKQIEQNSNKNTKNNLQIQIDQKQPQHSQINHSSNNNSQINPNNSIFKNNESIKNQETQSNQFKNQPSIHNSFNSPNQNQTPNPSINLNSPSSIDGNNKNREYQQFQKQNKSSYLQDQKDPPKVERTQQQYHQKAVEISLSSKVQQKSNQILKSSSHLSQNQHIPQPILSKQNNFSSNKELQNNLNRPVQPSLITVGFYLDPLSKSMQKNMELQNKIRTPVILKDSLQYSEQLISLVQIKSTQKLESISRQAYKNVKKIQKKASNVSEQSYDKLFKQHEDSNINSQVPSYLNLMEQTLTPHKNIKVKPLQSYEIRQQVDQQSNILGTNPKNSIQIVQFKQTQSFFHNLSSRQANLISTQIIRNIKRDSNNQKQNVKQQNKIAINEEFQQKFHQKLDLKNSQFCQKQIQNNLEISQTNLLIASSSQSIIKNQFNKQNQSNKTIKTGQHQLSVEHFIKSQHSQKDKLSNQAKQNSQIQEQINKQDKRYSYQNVEEVYHQSYNFQLPNQQPLNNRKRVGTEFNQKLLKPSKQKFKIINRQRNHSNIQQTNKFKYQASEHDSSVFQTQIFPTNMSLANSKLAKIRQTKQYKKKKLQEELIKINDQINVLSKKQAQIRQFGSPGKNFNERLKIDRNLQAKQKALSLVRNLQKQRKNRQIQKIQSIDKIDGKINNYMSELTKIRSENQRKLKEKKKLQIIERMRNKQMKRINQIKKIQASSKFVSQFLRNNQYRQSRQQVLSPLAESRDVYSPQIKKRVQSKIDDDDQSLTPQLSNKKAFLNKVRNISQKKSRQQNRMEYKNPYQNKLY